MKKVLFGGCLGMVALVVLVLGLVAVIGAVGMSGGSGGGSGADEIRIKGAAGIPVSCAIEDGAGSRSVDVKAPDAIKIEAGAMDIVGATCQKTGAQGELTAQVVIDGKVEAEQTTSAQYGVVTVMYPE